VPRDKEPRAEETQDDSDQPGQASSAHYSDLDDALELGESPPPDTTYSAEIDGWDTDYHVDPGPLAQVSPGSGSESGWIGTSPIYGYSAAADMDAEFDEDMDDQGGEFEDEEDDYYDGDGDWAEWQYEAAEYGLPEDDLDLPIVCCVDFTPV